MQAILEQTDEDSKAVAHGSPKADLVGFRAVMRRNGNLSHLEPLFLKLDEHLRVKMKLIRALFKGYLLQSFAGISPKAGVVFGKLHSERPVFDGDEELVPASKAMIKMPMRFMPTFCYGAWRGGFGALGAGSSKSASNCAFPC